MEGILKASVTNNYYGEPGSVARCVVVFCMLLLVNLIVLFRTPNMDVLRELIDSRYTVYDVLPTFFNDTDQEVIHGE